MKVNEKIVLLKQQIENAFMPLKYPGDNNIVWISEYDPEKIEIKEEIKVMDAKEKQYDTFAACLAKGG